MNRVKAPDMCDCGQAMIPHPRCSWCGLFFGPNHEGKIAGQIRGRTACNWCMREWDKYGDEAFPHALGHSFT